MGCLQLKLLLVFKRAYGQFLGPPQSHTKMSFNSGRGGRASFNRLVFEATRRTISALLCASATAETFETLRGPLKIELVPTAVYEMKEN